MSPHIGKMAILLVAATLLQACAIGRMTPSVLGREVKLIPRAGGTTVQGELLAANPDGVLVLAKGGVKAVATTEIREVRVRRHGFDGRKAWTWTLVGALVSAVGLSAACSSVEGTTSCGGVAVAGAAPWLIFGGLSALSAQRTAFQPVEAGRPEVLRRFARYPQGLPPGLDLHRLAQPPLIER